jgi:hypothetical protein
MSFTLTITADSPAQLGHYINGLFALMHSSALRQAAAPPPAVEQPAAEPVVEAEKVAEPRKPGRPKKTNVIIDQPTVDLKANLQESLEQTDPGAAAAASQMSEEEAHETVDPAAADPEPEQPKRTRDEARQMLIKFSNDYNGHFGAADPEARNRAVMHVVGKTKAGATKLKELTDDECDTLYRVIEATDPSVKIGG